MLSTFKRIEMVLKDPTQLLGSQLSVKITFCDHYLYWLVLEYFINKLCLINSLNNDKTLSINSRQNYFIINCLMNTVCTSSFISTSVHVNEGSHKIHLIA